MVEKPLDVTVERVDRIIEAAQKGGVKLTGIFPLRFMKGAGLAKRAIDEGRLGRLVLADAYIKWYRDQAYYDSSDWKGTWALDGGGALMNQGIHNVDLLYYLEGVKNLLIVDAAETGKEAGTMIRLDSRTAPRPL